MSQPDAETKDDLSREDRAFLKDLGVWLAERRMSTPALLFLESVKPLNFVGSQVLFFFEPMVKALIPLVAQIFFIPLWTVPTIPRSCSSGAAMS